MRKKSIIVELIIILSTLIVFCASKLIGIYNEYHEAEKEYEKLLEYIEEPEEKPKPETKQEPVKEEPYLKIDFAGLQQVNPEVVAWIQIPGVEISYPVAKGQDNSYYLSHLITGEYSKSGSIFVDYHNQVDFSDENTIIYGHNMRDGSMFAALDKYRNAEVCKDYPYFYIYVPGYVLEYQIISCYAGHTGGMAYTYHFPEPSDFQKFLSVVMENANYDIGAGAEVTDRIVTLSTCVNSRREYRYLVHGKLVRKIEDMELFEE